MVTANGWPVPPREATHTFVIPGDKARLNLLDNYAGFCLAVTSLWFSRNIEDLDQGCVPDDWAGVKPRPIGGSNSPSRHGAFLAVDLNATQHGRGARRTFSEQEIREIHTRLWKADCLSRGMRSALIPDLPPTWNSNTWPNVVIRWGEDYVKAPVDGMHFEWNLTPHDDMRGRRLAVHYLQDTPLGREIGRANPSSRFVRRHRV